MPENLILCSHCPYYAEGGRHTLRCHANIGLLKLWKFDPRPMNSVEKGGFLGAVGGLLAVPIIANWQGGETLAATGGLLSSAAWSLLMRRFVCSECPNFSCPLNTVPEATRRAYLLRNPIFAEAWGLTEDSTQDTKRFVKTDIQGD